MTPIPPHLAHLPRSGNLPVPHVVARHKIGRSALALSTWEGFDLMTVWEGESGPPDFGKYDDERLRQSMVHGVCHLCWTKPKYPLVCVPREPQRREVDGKPATLLVQPWVCAPCLGYAVQTCPPLMMAIERGNGLVFSIRTFRLVSTLWQRANDDDPVAPEGARVLSMFKILPMKAGVQELREWVEGPGRKYR